MSDEIDALILARQAGALSVEEHRRLERLLRDDPAATRRLAYWSRQAVDLRLLLGASAHADRGRRRRAALAAAASVALAAAAALVALMVWPEGDGVTTPSLEQVLAAAPPAPPAEAEPPFVAGAALTLADGSVITREDDARLRRLPAAAGDLLALDDGRIACDVRARAADAPLLVRTPQLELRVVGTRFSVAVSGGTTRVAVEEGAVTLHSARGDRVGRVQAGQWRSVDGRGHDSYGHLGDLGLLRPWDGATPAGSWRTLFDASMPRVLARMRGAVHAEIARPDGLLGALGTVPSSQNSAWSVFELTTRRAGHFLVHPETRLSLVLLQPPPAGDVVLLVLVLNDERGRFVTNLFHHLRPAGRGWNVGGIRVGDCFVGPDGDRSVAELTGMRCVSVIGVVFGPRSREMRLGWLRVADALRASL